MKLHRNSQKRIYFKDAIYFVTCKAFDNYPYFKERIFCDLFVENLRLCKRLKGFLLFGWVLTYDHFHLLVMPGDGFNISKIMQFLKRHINRDINFLLYSEGGIRESRLREKIRESRLREKIRESRLLGGEYEHLQSIIDEHDKKLILSRLQFHQNHSNPHSHPPFRWQESFHDHYIRNNRDFDYHMDYIEYNPVKHDLPDNWPYIFTNPDYEDLIDEC
ncbi:transposase [Candidatus Peregrinibacteria bacterium]|nr:transposase [Candidatus Peregrinibacteria bacterium]